MNDGYEKIEEAITKEITAAQLSGSKHKFKCSVCGSRHSVGNKTWQKCIRKYKYNQCQYIRDFYLNDYLQKLYLQYQQIRIEIILPGFSLYSLYNKSDEIIAFLKDYYEKIIQLPSNDNISIRNNRIIYNYSDELSQNSPYLFLIENYSEYVTNQYEKTLIKKLPIIKNLLLEISQVIKNHAGLFLDPDLRFGSDDKISEYNRSRQIDCIAQTFRGSRYEAAKDFIRRLIMLHYNNSEINSYYYNIDDIVDKGDSKSYYYMGNLYAQGSNFDKSRLRISISMDGHESNTRTQNFLADVIKHLLPVEQIMQHMIASAEKERKRKIRKKQDDQQISLDMLASL